MDPISILALAGTIVSAIFSATGPILVPLWRKIKALYGRVCRSTSYLRGLGQERVTADVWHLLKSDMALRVAAQRHYVSGRTASTDDGGGYSSDFSDFEF